MDNVFLLFEIEKDVLEYKCNWCMCMWYIFMLECLVFMLGYVDKMFMDLEGGFLV